jgi:hypothetical protein
MNGTDAPVLAWWLDWPSAMPRTGRRIERANQLLEATGTLPACRHVLAHARQDTGHGWAPFRALCVACPAEGLRCRDCHNAHVTSDTDPHTWTAEHTCDECGAVVEWISPFALLLNLAPPHLLRVRGLDGRRRIVSAPVSVRGFGVCHRCRRKVLP